MQSGRDTLEELPERCLDGRDGGGNFAYPGRLYSAADDRRLPQWALAEAHESEDTEAMPRVPYRKISEIVNGATGSRSAILHAASNLRFWCFRMSSPGTTYGPQMDGTSGLHSKAGNFIVLAGFSGGGKTALAAGIATSMQGSGTYSWHRGNVQGPRSWKGRSLGPPNRDQAIPSRNAEPEEKARAREEIFAAWPLHSPRRKAFTRSNRRRGRSRCPRASSRRHASTISSS